MPRKPPMALADVLFTKTQQRILSHLLGSGGKSLYLNELVRLADIGKGTIKRELDRMVACGLLLETRTGNRVHFAANPQCPVGDELRSIVSKTFGLAMIIAAALKPAAAAIGYAFIHGPSARGVITPSREIELMVIGNGITYSRIMQMLKPAEAELGRPFDLLIYSVADFNRRLASGNGFLRRAMDQDKIPVLGTAAGVLTPEKGPRRPKGGRAKLQ